MNLAVEIDRHLYYMAVVREFDIHSPVDKGISAVGRPFPLISSAGGEGGRTCLDRPMCYRYIVDAPFRFGALTMHDYVTWYELPVAHAMGHLSMKSYQDAKPHSGGSLAA